MAVDEYFDRIREYGVPPGGPVAAVAGTQATGTPTAQYVLLGLINMLARAHVEVVLGLPNCELLVSVPGVPAGSTTLVEAAAHLANAANPFLTVRRRQVDAEMPTIGLGIDSPPANVYVGGQGWTGTTATEPQPVGDQTSSVLGAGLAATMAAAWALRATLRMTPLPPASVSLWTLTEATEPTGPAELDPLDVGTILMIGAGAVASGLIWWAACRGITGQLIAVDGDFVELHNLSRALALFADDAGWPDGTVANKAQAAARHLPGLLAIPRWWDQANEDVHVVPDVVIPVANERGIRPAISAAGYPTVLHATTGRQWTSELHRHLRPGDDCVACRLPESAFPTFACATGEIKPKGQKSSDAALSFLSGGAGLLLLASLYQLQHGQLRQHDPNHWVVASEPERRARLATARHRCSAACPSPPIAVTRRQYGNTRWASFPGLSEASSG